MLDAVFTGLVGGYLGDRLFKLVPPKRKSKFDVFSRDHLKSRNDWIDVRAQIVWTGSFLISAAVVLICGADAWRTGFTLGFPVILLFLFVGFATLSHGWGRFCEFWRYHELKHRIRLGVLMSLYIPCAVLGFVCTIKIIG
jgi:hypothetical protein